MSASTYTNVPC